jgi:hypothetical protein
LLFTAGTLVGAGFDAAAALASVAEAAIFWRAPLGAFVGVVVAADMISGIAGTFLLAARALVGAGRDARTILALVIGSAVLGRAPNVAAKRVLDARLISIVVRTLL